MRAPVNGTLPGSPVRTSGVWMRRLLTTGLAVASAGYVMVTTAPSGKADPPSNTTTPFCTRPEMTMPSFFISEQGNQDQASARATLRRP